ncbi:MAG: succinylglutamate desuccinylase [Alteromonadaceae bacterium]|nr:succinylglutamate desuccinylase [Alteromonadaceae bacterium]
MTVNALISLFNGRKSFLDHTLTLTETKPGQTIYPVQTVLEDGATVTLLAEGILKIEPSKPPKLQLILSAGIHGDETAPIELCDSMVTRLLSGEFTAGSRALVIFGNPAAMRQQNRYVDQNLNRLFGRAHVPTADERCLEKRRAAELEQQVRRFVLENLPLFHYDLHTALRDSQREKFALYPYVPLPQQDGHTQAKELPSTQARILLASDVTTVLHHHKPQNTFSSWTANAFAAESFTLELGKVHPFGKNDLSRISRLGRTLTELLQGTLPCEAKPGQLEQFRVVHEVIKTSKDFVLNIEDNVANFTAYPEGTQIWRDAGTEYRVKHSAEFIVFPNRHVPVGERVGLLLANLTDPG